MIATKYSSNRLDAEKIAQTVSRLQTRIGERFPNFGLHQVSMDLEQISQQAARRAVWIGRPIIWLRVLTCVVCSMIVVAGIVLPFTVDFQEEALSFADFVSVLEAGVNDVVLIGALFFFLFTIERRIKRGRALAAIHELRSLAHIIDMHQLTKDPERVTSKFYLPTNLSPKVAMDGFQLRRYLDYCSEMLSLTGKIAAGYVQEFDDPVALAAVNEVESLTTGLSRKIWQKIMILYTQSDQPASSAPTQS